ncbi:MAG: hypothetical protein IIA14_01675, partial [SAR324 cluster bacterium]|nr:hypothetical protein [SAR324 cluster bacterium]
MGGDARALILGSEERTTLGDRSDLVVGAWVGIAGTDLTFKATLAANTSVDGVGVTSAQAVSVSGAPITGGTKTIEATGTLT